AVDRVRLPVGASDFWQGGTFRRNEGPVFPGPGVRVRPGGALVDPVSNQSELRGIEWLAAHRHARQISGARYAPVEQAGSGITRLDDRAGFTSCERRLFRVQPQSTHLQLRPVAGIA